MEMEGIHGNATLSLSTAFTTSYAVPNWLMEQFGAPQNSREIFISAPTLSENNVVVQLLLL